MAENDCDVSTWHMLSFTTSNKEIDNTDWFALDVRCYGKTFTISVDRKNLHESNTLEAEFDIMLRTLSLASSREPLLYSEDDSVDQDSVTEAEIDDQQSECTHPHNPSASEISVRDCFEWAMKPCSAAIESLAPPPKIEHGDKITLEYFFCVERYDTELSAVQDKFLEPEFQRSRDFSHYDYADSPQEDTRDWKSRTTFPVLSRGEVEVTPGPDSLEYILLDEPTRVKAHGRQLYFKHAGDDCHDLALVEVHKYENIKRADFPADVRTSCLYGIVEDEKSQILGLLYEDIGRDAFPLDFEEVMSAQTPESLRGRWINQIRHTIRSLHQVGVVWGDAKAGNILVDQNGRGDAWVIDFGGGYTEGWVDREKSNTIEGDLQGLTRIIDYLQTGKRGR